jgi:two-component system chemotaxis response regulator CheY
MQRRKILIVDDDQRFAEMVAHRLREHADCVISLHGEDALLQFENSLREKKPFHAVLMDIEMPTMDGHEVVEKMRKVEERNNVPPLDTFKLVMLTVHKDVKNVSKSFFRGGAEAYIPKEHLSDAEKFTQELRENKIL